MVNVIDKWFFCVLVGEAQYICFLLHLWFIIFYILEVNIGIFLSPFQKAKFVMGKYKW